MHEQLKTAFGAVRASEQIKAQTRAAVVQQMYRETRKKQTAFHRTAAAAACMLLLLTGGYWLYFTPTAQISIDINPSMELHVNRFDRVIGADGLNDDGKQLLESVQVQFETYQDALEQILESESVTELLADDAEMTITVVGPDDVQCTRMLSQIEACTSGQRGVHCYHADAEDAAAAHELGLPYGKYNAFLTLQQLDPTVTPEEVQSMTMRELRDRIESLDSDLEQAGESSWGSHGHGYRYGHN